MAIATASADTRSDASQKRPLRIAYLSPSALVDPASGASQSVMTMLAALSDRGVYCHALSASCFDSPPGEALPQFLAGYGMKPMGKTKGGGLLVWSGATRGVKQHMMQVSSQKRMGMTALEEVQFRDMAEDWLKQVRPDVILTFGGLVLDMELMRLSQRAGAAVAFYLANPNYSRPQTFEHADIVITNSASTSAHYREKMRLDALNVGLFVDPESFRVDTRQPIYVTFINPQPEKGVTLFLKLVEKAAKQCPDMRFLVVESRGHLLPAMQKMGMPESLLASITLLPRQSDMRQIYEKTKILLMPSFWFEAAGRVLIEATSNGIPVIATKRGGIPETLAGGGVLLDIPAACVNDHWYVPNDSELDPWWKALHSLWTDANHYREQSEVALQASATHSLSAKTGRLLRLFHGLAVQRQQKLQPQQQAKQPQLVNVA